MRFLYFIMIIFISCACSPINDELAQQNVATFHEMYQGKNYSGIYLSTSDTFKGATMEKDFIKLLTEAEITDLGVFKKSTLKTKKTIYHPFDNNEVYLIYTSEYSKRNVYETFVFETINGKMELKGYKYESLN